MFRLIEDMVYNLFTTSFLFLNQVLYITLTHKKRRKKALPSRHKFDWIFVFTGTRCSIQQNPRLAPTVYVALHIVYSL